MQQKSACDPNVRRTPRWIGRARAAAAAIAFMCAVAACGDSESETEPSPGPCLTAGDTRQCVGPAACSGGQTCLPDGTWSACDCGTGSGGSSGRGAGGSSGASGSGAGGVAGNAAQGGVGGSSATAGTTSTGGTSGAAGSGGSAGSSGSSGNGGTTGSGGSAGAGGSGGLPAKCTGHPGPLMVDMGGWCIDSHEVTQVDYAQFLAAKGSDMSGQLAQCSTNTSYDPKQNVACGNYAYDPVGKADRPITCVDWCDAYAYCAWAGKRLCGKIGGGAITTSTSPYTIVVDPSVSEWAHACSNGGQSEYPYGDTVIFGNCNDPSLGSTPDPAVKSHPNCHGQSVPYDQVYDLAGYPAEWIHTQSAVGTLHAIRVGGLAGDGNDAFSCVAYVQNTIATANTYTSFRCCSL